MNRFSKVFVAGMSFLCVFPVLAQTAYPSKPVRIINAFAAGGGSDLIARGLAVNLSKDLGQQFIVENRVGAGGIIGTDYAAKSAPDGYTLVVGSSAAFSIAPNIERGIPYDPVKDFAPIGTYATFPYVMVVVPSLPVKTAQDLIALAKARPGQINFASAGSGTTSHLAFEHFMQMTGIKMTHIPFKGAAPASQAIIGGHVDVGLELLNASPQIKQGLVRPIGVTTLVRSKEMPDVPTISESGAKGFEAANWQGLFAPAKTSRQIIDLLNRDINAIVKRGDLKTPGGAQTMSGTPEELGQLLQSEINRFAELIKRADIKAE